MKTFIFIAVMLAMLAVMGSLLFGLFNMAKEGQEHRQKSNKTMWVRIYLQAVAILLMFIFGAMS
tara:strand:+ start:583 stop:774 length:192 start_codon:yes stop_codon:yes gene_type:complete